MKMRTLLTAALVLLAVYGTSTLAPAFAQDEGEAPRRASQTLDQGTAVVLQKVFEMIQLEQYQAALAELNRLIAERGDRMKPFDRATTFEMRGSVKVSLDDYRGALQDFQAAIQTGALPPERVNQLRYFVAQIHFQLQDYQAAINGLNEWIRSATASGQRVDPNAYYLLAAAYTQIRPPNWNAARSPGEQALAGITEPRKSYYDLMNLIYSELNANAQRASLLERMINFWPQERSYWTQLSGLYASINRDSDAFAVLEVAYRAGLLRSESEVLTLVQYFSFYDNPYRGAKLLEREIGTGTVKKTVKNLTLLSQLWSQAREHKRAIPVLQEASRMADSGELSYRLGQVLLADEQYAASERALMAALNKGGMRPEQVADCWLLLGTARFSQAGPGDRVQRQKAREAFVRAQNYDRTRSQARSWVEYIDAITTTERLQDELEIVQAKEQRQLEIQRTRQSLQVCRLQNKPAAECAALEKRLQELITMPAAAAPAPVEPPAGGQAPAPEDAPAEEPASQ